MLKHSLIALTAMAAGLMGAGVTGASAFPVTQPAVQSDSSPLLTDVRTRYDRNYGHNYHGDRCGSWSNHCRYHHGGYWYATPWWTLPLVGGIALGAAGAGVYDDGYNDGGYGGGYDGGGYGSRHVRWCMDRYRSYNPRTNTWVGYGGRVHQCVSPYGS